jgi:transcriptional regulator with XRE-family HTH domain
MQTLGKLVVAARQDRGWTQADLARKARCHLNTIVSLEKSHLQTRVSTIRHVARALGVPADDLLTAPIREPKASKGERTRP